jgi:hypothetical protein
LNRQLTSRRAFLLQAGATAFAQALPSTASAAPAAGGAQPIRAFSTAAAGGTLPAPWRVQALRGVVPNRHALVTDEGSTVLEIASGGSASSLLHPLGPVAAGRLRWRWKTDAWPSLGGFGTRAGDDFAARVYLMFDYPLDRVPLAQRLLLGAARSLHGEDLPAATLCYLLDPRAPAGTLLESPYTSRVRMIVVRAPARPGGWWEEERDVEADFRRAFGEEHGPGVPPLRAVAVAADTDQGGGALRTRFGDLELR